MTESILNIAPGKEASLAARLKYAREAAGLNQQELGEAAGLTQTSISWLENGKSLRTGRLAEIAKALSVDAQWLASGIGAAPDPLALREQEMRIGAEKWEALYRNERANSSRLLDIVIELRAEIAAQDCEIESLKAQTNEADQ